MSGGALFSASVDASEVGELLEAYQRKNRDLSPTMRLIAEDMVTAVGDEFDTAGRGNWAALAPSTIKRRRASGLGAQILQDTGRFAASINPHWGPDFAEAATDVSYSVFHVDGKGRMYRNPFDLPESFYDEAAATLLAEIRDP